MLNIEGQQQTRNLRTKWRHYALLAALTVLYFAASKLGLHFFGLIHPSASAAWPPTGVAIAALLLFGQRTWPAIFLPFPLPQGERGRITVQPIKISNVAALCARNKIWEPCAQRTPHELIS